jgi:hypothetical protein
MKKLITSLTILVIVLVSCSKEQPYRAALIAEDPKVVRYNFFKVSAGSNESVGFDVVLSIPDTNAVTEIKLLRIPYSLRWEVLKPKSGLYRMYDHLISDYPNYGQDVWYFFEFKMKNGTSVFVDKFQVY